MVETGSGNGVGGPTGVVKGWFGCGGEGGVCRGLAVGGVEWGGVGQWRGIMRLAREGPVQPASGGKTKWLGEDGWGWRDRAVRRNCVGSTFSRAPHTVPDPHDPQRDVDRSQ